MTPNERWRFYFALFFSDDKTQWFIDGRLRPRVAMAAGEFADMCCAEEDKRFPKEGPYR